MDKTKGLKHKGIKRFIITFSLCGAVVLSAVGIGTYIDKSKASLETLGEFSREIDHYATPMAGENTEKLAAPEGGGAVSLSISKVFRIDLSEGKAKLTLENPLRSTQSVIFRLCVRNKIIMQSGIISPGYRIETGDLLNNVRLSKGEYDGKLIVFCIDSSGGGQANVRTEFGVRVVVEE